MNIAYRIVALFTSGTLLFVPFAASAYMMTAPYGQTQYWCGSYYSAYPCSNNYWSASYAPTYGYSYYDSMYNYNNQPYNNNNYNSMYTYAQPYNYNYNHYSYVSPSCTITASYQYNYAYNGNYNGNYNAPVTLAWSSSNANTAAISGVGTVLTSGSTTITPNGNQWYTMTVSGPGGTNSCQVYITGTYGNNTYGSGGYNNYYYGNNNYGYTNGYQMPYYNSYPYQTW